MTLHEVGHMSGIEAGMHTHTHTSQPSEGRTKGELDVQSNA
jgi:hypothetical protein